MFNMKCQVTSDTTRKVMISREVKVASYREICGEEKVRVHIGYNNDMMRVENNKLLQYPPERIPQGVGNTRISRGWEVLYIFFSSYNIEPIWQNCNFSWGWYDEEQGAWTGCMGKVLILKLITDRDS